MSLRSQQDEFLDKFLTLCHAAEQHKIPQRIGEANFEGELKKSISGLVQAKSGPLVRFMPLLLDKLVSLMVRPPVVSGQVGKLFGQISETIALQFNLLIFN